jgi:Ca2+/Na+ antiporter
MLLGIVFLVVAAVALVAGSSLLGNGLGSAVGQRLPAGAVRSVAIGLAGALATTVVAIGQDRTELGSGVPFGAAMFVLAAVFGAAALLGRRRLEVREPILYAAPAAGIVLLGLSVASDRSLSRWTGVLLSVLYVPYLAWVLLEPAQEPPQQPDEGDPPAAVPPAPAGAQPVLEADADPVAEPVEAAGPAGGWLLRTLAGAAVVVGGAFALVEGATRVSDRAPLAPGFAGAALAGSLTALPFALLVVFPRQSRSAGDPGEGTMTVLAGLISLVPGVAAIVRPFALDGPSAVCVLAVALLYAIAAAWMLVRGRSDRVMGAVVLLAYAACLVIAGSL